MTRKNAAALDFVLLINQKKRCINDEFGGFVAACATYEVANGI